MSAPTTKAILAAIMARLDTIEGSASAGAASTVVAPPSAKRSHWKNRDLDVPCCDKTFRTLKGRKFHTTSTHKA